MSDILITDDNYLDHINPIVNGEKKACGLIPRDFAAIPFGSIPQAPAFSMPTIARDEWDDRLAAQKAEKGSLMDIRDRGMNGQPIPSRDQDGYGYCWAHSSTSATLLARARDNQPYADLSAFAVACIIKNYRNQGGWGGESLQFIAERGIPTSQFWPQQSTSRANDNPQTWADAGKHKAQEWAELDPSAMEDQLVTCLLLGIPVVVDYNWWGHSVCAAAIESFAGSGSSTHIAEGWIWNSWSDTWSNRGMGRLSRNKFIPNQAWALMTTFASTP